MAKKRRMSAKQRKFFGKRKKASASYSVSKRRVHHNSKQMLPLTMEEHGYAFATGAIIGPLSEFTKPVQQKYLGMFGQYSDEAAVGGLGWAGWKFGSGMVKKLGKELYRGAVFSTGATAGSDMVRGVFNRFGGGSSQVSGRIESF